VWKQIIVTALMFRKAVIPIAKTTVKKVQAVENSIYRYLLGVGGYTTIGASRMEMRAMETVLMYIKESLEGNFEKIKSYLEHDIVTEGSEWMRTVNEYNRELSIHLELG